MISVIPLISRSEAPKNGTCVFSMLDLLKVARSELIVRELMTYVSPRTAEVTMLSGDGCVIDNGVPV